MASRNSRFAPLPFPVRNPKTPDYKQRVANEVAYTWLHASGFSARTGNPPRSRKASPDVTPEIRTTCHQCSSLAIDGTCTLAASHQVT